MAEEQEEKRLEQLEALVHMANSHLTGLTVAGRQGELEEFRAKRGYAVFVSMAMDLGVPLKARISPDDQLVGFSLGAEEEERGIRTDELCAIRRAVWDAVKDFAYAGEDSSTEDLVDSLVVAYRDAKRSWDYAAESLKQVSLVLTGTDGEGMTRSALVEAAHEAMSGEERWAYTSESFRLIDEALGLDPEECGREETLEAIAKLKEKANNPNVGAVTFGRAAELALSHSAVPRAMWMGQKVYMFHEDGGLVLRTTPHHGGNACTFVNGMQAINWYLED